MLLKIKQLVKRFLSGDETVGLSVMIALAMIVAISNLVADDVDNMIIFSLFIADVLMFVLIFRLTERK